ncbi:uncharacterized protein GGS22DRAFT_24263 [Annulohypoxylon maeteangense]|uniref:uncharacterized protein n=1 Tax=Annulohypoxylon maeteangense TaxID=1927788 RepID=UPI0020072950|nr:uncharacterized protein GGS22DRAFT_24263 [Annulohypoxylon maeteangense]KAI0883670.1 hypothetical protein GGS22DRAFT_24263 [Annulohypoxylon maeteangense]
MHVPSILSALVLATCAVSSPVGPVKGLLAERAPSNVCVLIEGDDGYVIDPFNRPQCACKCIKQACVQPDPADTDLCLRTPWPDANGGTPFPDTLVRYAACVGGTHCVGG